MVSGIAGPPSRCHGLSGHALGLAHPHLFFFRELLFVPVSLTRREELKSQVLSD